MLCWVHLFPVAVPGIRCAWQSRLASCRPGPLAQVVSSASGGARARGRLRCPTLSLARTPASMVDRCTLSPLLHPPPAALGLVAVCGARPSRRCEHLPRWSTAAHTAPSLHPPPAALGLVAVCGARPSRRCEHLPRWSTAAHTAPSLHPPPAALGLVAVCGARPSPWRERLRRWSTAAH